MARLIGLVLMILGIYLGVSSYTGGADDGSADDAATAADGWASSDVDDRGQAAPRAVTSRVRDRVTSAVEEGARRHSGE